MNGEKFYEEFKKGLEALGASWAHKDNVTISLYDDARDDHRFTWFVMTLEGRRYQFALSPTERQAV